MQYTIPQYLQKIHQQKQELDSLRPFNVFQLQNLKDQFRVQFTHQSNALEGNSLSITEVKVLIEDGITIGGKQLREINETVNHSHIVKNLRHLGENLSLTQEFILSLHTDLMRHVIVDELLGARRPIQVQVTGSDEVFPLPKTLSVHMNVFCQTRKNGPKTVSDCAQIHYDFVKIHPFADGNGRIARLLMNLGLVSLGYFPIIIPHVLRTEYIETLRTDKSLIDFTHFFLRQVYENHKDYLRFLSNT